MATPRSIRVLILEVSAAGHHPYHVRLLLDSGLAEFADIILASQQEVLLHPAIATSSTPFQPYRIDLPPPLILEPGISDFAPLLRMQWGLGALYRRAFFALSRNAPIDFVIVPYLDNCMINLAASNDAFGSTPWLALTMRTMLHYRYMGVVAPEQRFAPIRRWLLNRILRQRSMTALLTIDPTLAVFAQQQRNPQFRKIRYVPDPVVHHYPSLPSNAVAKQRLGIPIDACTVLLYGAITERKGAAFLVRAAAAPDCSDQIHVVLAGRIRMPDDFLQGEALHALRTANRIHIFEGFIDDEHEKLLLASADCMWVGYVDFYGASGVMALAGRHGVPVLASDYGLVGYFTKKYELGAIIEPRKQASVVAALNRLVKHEDPDFFRRAGRNGISVFQNYSPLEFQRVVVETVAKSCGRSQ